MAERFDSLGRKLGSIDDMWIVQVVRKDGLRLVNSRTDHTVFLPYDCLHNFRIDLSVRDGLKHGPSRLAAEAAAAHNSSGSRVRGACASRNSLNRRQAPPIRRNSVYLSLPCPQVTTFGHTESRMLAESSRFFKCFQCSEDP